MNNRPLSLSPTLRIAPDHPGLLSSRVPATGSTTKAPLTLPPSPQMNYQNKDHLVGALIIAGFDDNKGGQVFGCPIGGTLSSEKWAIDGSGSTFIWAYCDSEYR